MVFSSTVFLFLFLPFVLGINLLLGKKYRNFFILICSLFFYAWGENILVLLMIASICVNYLMGLSISYSINKNSKFLKGFTLALGISLNLLVLFYFKYTDFILENLRLIGYKFPKEIGNIALPIGVSFFTFQNISYLVDVYRKEVESQKNLLHLGLYISLFPQLIAGPIVRYADIYREIKNRIITRAGFVEGIKRFIRGLAKKVIIANNTVIVRLFSFNKSRKTFFNAFLFIIIPPSFDM